MKVGRFKLETAEDLRRNGIRICGRCYSDRTHLLLPHSTLNKSHLRTQASEKRRIDRIQKGYLNKTKEKNRAVFFKKTRLYISPW